MKFENTAIIVVDMQKCFAHPEGSLYSEKSEEVVESIENFVTEARDKSAKVVYTKDTHTKEQFEELDHYDEFAEWGEHAVKGSWEHDIVDELTVKENDEIVEKGTYDAFHNTDLDEKLEDIDNVIVVGTLANVCVLHTASSAALNDYNTMVVENLVGYIKEEHKDYALDHVEWLFGEVKNSEDIL